MTIPNWLPTLLNQSFNQSDKLSLSPDLRWITEYALTDGFSESILLHASYEVFERETTETVDRGFATVTMFRATKTKWQSENALEVRLSIDWFESTKGFISDREEDAHWYFTLEGSFVGFSWRGETYAVQYDKKPPWQWVEGIAQPIGALQEIKTEGDPGTAHLVATLESIEQERMAFRISAVPALDSESSYGFTTWVTESDGTPRAHFVSSVITERGKDLLVTLMVRF